ncbi:unnamed protein product [Adineta ricciae]|uniref:Uncharacterized protein n=1 Tax=Adineta ricciae TaxID=249248 RepID=A0A815IZ09_ADIRI|nr:unnamed protein product [Adineta ricciae]CAF1374841.1 unnamed protein product [Adineta ricciae]
MGYADITMKVEEAFKGVTAGDEIIVRTSLQGAICGRSKTPVSQRWQMWLTENKGAHSCSRSTRDVQKDIAALRQLANS